MTPAARIETSAALLDQILDGQPAEKILTTWARKSRFAGSKDRAAVRDHVYGALRCKRSFGAYGGAMTGRGLMIGALRALDVDPSTIFSGVGYGPDPLSDAERDAVSTPEGFGEIFDLPDWIVDHFTESLGNAAELNAKMLQTRAPVFLRVNTRKSTIEDAIEELGHEGIIAQAHRTSPTALEVTTGARRIANSLSYLDGLVELQDGASQAVVDKIGLSDGVKVLDYCAGGGGKSLALAARATQHRDISLFAYDADPNRMKNLAERADRAGARISILENEGLEENGPYEVVLCDAPCSGSGAWRRSPEGKWALTATGLAELNEIQDDISDQAQSLVAIGGTLIYATCSLLEVENSERARAFVERNPQWKQCFSKQWTLEDGADGFYTAHFVRA